MSYTKTTWVSGEQITATKLNNAEDGIESLDQRMESVEKRTSSFASNQGELLHIDPSIDSPVRDIILYGRSTQSGTPTPSSPVNINTSGSSGTLNITSCGKNIFNPTEAGRTVREVVWTKNADGTYTANGTANGGNSVFGTGTIYLPAGTTVVVKACPSGGSSTTYNAYLYDRTTSDYPRGYSGGTLDTGNGMVYTLQDSHLYSLNCRIMSGKTGSNLVFKPELYISSSLDISSEAYSSSTFPVTVPETGLPGIAVSSDGNYTDPAGQQWICDTIDLGKGVYTKRVHVVTFNGSEDWNVSNYGTSNWYYSIGNAGQLPKCPSIDTPVLSSHYPFATISNSNTNQGICVGQGNTYGFVRVRYGSEDTKENFKTWLASNNLTLAYPMTNPVETPLTDTQLSQLRAISTRKNETYMYTDGGSGMYVENFVNEKDLTDHLETTVDVLAIKPTATGSVASFSDGSDGLPVKDLTITINPKQAGSGDPSPSNVRAISGWTGANVTACSKNLLKPNVQTQTMGTIVVTIGSDGRVTLSAGSYGDTAFHGVTAGSTWLPAGTYVFSGQNDVDPVNKLVTLQIRNETLGAQIINKDDGGDYEFTLNSPGLIKVNVGFRVGATLSAPATMLPMIRKIGAESGFVPFNGTTYPITFPAAAGTVYGGSLDVTTGLLTVDRAFHSFTGSETFTTYATGDNKMPKYTPGDCVATTDAACVSNMLRKATSYSDQTGNAGTVRLIEGSVVIHMSGYKGSSLDVNAFKTALGNLDPKLQVVYPLATPVTYQLSPTEVTTLLGANNIWADTGDSTVTYLADTKLYIDNAIAALQALVLEN